MLFHPVQGKSCSLGHTDNRSILKSTVYTCNSVNTEIYLRNFDLHDWKFEHLI